MNAPSAASARATEPLEERIRRVSPLRQIESHEWSEPAWPSSERLLDAAEAEVALARGRLIYERFLRSGPDGYPAAGADGRPALPLFRRAVELFRRSGNPAGEREALFWVGTLEQVLNRDYSAASLALEESRELAEAAKDDLVLSCVERHLGFIAFLEGMYAEAETHLEESVRLRRSMEFAPGVAMGIVALAELQLERHEVDRARRLLDEAAAVAERAGAQGATRAVERARQQAAATR